MPQAAVSPADPEAPIFRALLVPHRSLPPRGFRWLMGTLGAVSLASGIAFVSNGAWPVVGFFGLDVALVWVAFRASYRAARAREEVELTRLDLSIRHISPKGRVREAHFNPRWARFRVARREEIGIVGMRVSGEGRVAEIGEVLNPDDRETFAAAFASALSDARSR